MNERGVAKAYVGTGFMWMCGASRVYSVPSVCRQPVNSNTVRVALQRAHPVTESDAQNALMPCYRCHGTSQKNSCQVFHLLGAGQPVMCIMPIVASSGRAATGSFIWPRGGSARQ